MAEHFDYVIVGAGSAGCVLAARLSEEPAVKVLLLEAGGSDLNPLIRIPLGLGKLHQYKLHDWGYVSEPEPHVDGRRIETPRGKVLGGSSSINMMTFTRGDAAGFDRWARKGAPGWSYADVLPYFKKLERAADGESPVRGGAGPIGVQWTRVQDPLCNAWVEACAAHGIAFNRDLSSGSPEGIGRTQFSIRDGRRASAALTYLHPARRRSNLTVRTRALATRVLFDGDRAVGVDYLDRRGMPLTVRAEREIILSGGAYNTPHLLLLSGVGPADHLREHGIAVHADLPVGRNLQDHLMVMNLYARKQPGEFHRNLRFDRMALHMLRAQFLRSGYATTIPSGVMAFLRSRPELDTPDLEFMFPLSPPYAGLWFPGVSKPYADAFGIRPALLRPASRGDVTLRTSDPRQPPRIRFNFLSAPDDLAVLRHGLKLARDIARHRALDPFRGPELAPGEAARGDSELDAYIRRALLTVSHPACTCPMGNGPEAVVDPALRVRGIAGLRVVDASAMPDLISAHINACVLMMAEKAADLIRGG